MTLKSVLVSDTKIFCLHQPYRQAQSDSQSLPSNKTEEPKIQTYFKPVKEIQAGDRVLGLDQLPNLVKHSTSFTYEGPLIAIKHKASVDYEYILPESLILIKRRVQSLSTSGGWSSIPSGHFSRARELRNRMTPPEYKLWAILVNKGLGLKFRPQHPIGPYIVDFFARQAGLVIEVDGELAHSTPMQQEDDHNRQTWLESLGLTVLRYTASEIFSDLEGVVADISYHLHECIVNQIPQAQWIYAQHIKNIDSLYIGPDKDLTQVIKVKEIRLIIQCYQIIFENPGNFITTSLIHKV
ncbi:MAG: endonuclease domain-containing protein [Brevefilum sp.]|nr:endonuclease domain-containing protein [Brevefilum sp.]